MKKEMLINVLQPEECRIAIVEDGILEELYVERTSHESYTGNIYKGKIVNLEPAIQAAFVDFSVGRNGFLHVSDVEPQYYRRHLSEDAESTPRDRDREREPRPRDDRRPPRSPAYGPEARDLPPPPSYPEERIVRDRTERPERPERDRPDRSEKGRRDRSEPRRFGEGLVGDEDGPKPVPPTRPDPPLPPPGPIPTRSSSRSLRDGSAPTSRRSRPLGPSSRPPTPEPPSGSSPSVPPTSTSPEVERLAPVLASVEVSSPSRSTPTSRPAGPIGTGPSRPDRSRPSTNRPGPGPLRIRLLASPSRSPSPNRPPPVSPAGLAVEAEAVASPSRPSRPIPNSCSIRPSPKSRARSPSMTSPLAVEEDATPSAREAESARRFPNAPVLSHPLVPTARNGPNGPEASPPS